MFSRVVKVTFVLSPVSVVVDEFNGVVNGFIK